MLKRRMQDHNKCSTAFTHFTGFITQEWRKMNFSISETERQLAQKSLECARLREECEISTDLVKNQDFAKISSDHKRISELERKLDRAEAENQVHIDLI